VKKLLTCVLIAVFMVTLSATGFAAQKTFSDVPAKHWAYEAVAKLAKAGLIEGYDDGTYRGDKPMNRYEFAIATVKALDRFDRADNEQKKLIDKLSAEFAAELNRMGARLAKVETKTNTWLVGGDTRFRLLTNNPKYPDGTKLRGSDMTDFRIRLKFAGNINDKTSIEGRLTTNYGNKLGDVADATTPFGSTAYFDIFNVTHKEALGFDKIRLGRTPLDVIGRGLIGKPMAVDGITFYETLSPTAKLTAFTGNIKHSGTGIANQMSTIDFTWKLNDNFWLGTGYYWADFPGTSGTPGATMLVSAGRSFKSSTGADISVKWKLGNLTLLGDYVASKLNGAVGVPSSPKAWSVQLTNGTGPGAQFAYYPTSYQIVNRTKKGDNAWAIIYRSADAGAVPGGAGGFDTTAVSYNSSVYSPYLRGTDNSNVLYLVFQTVLDKNVILSFEWQDFKVKHRSLTTLTNSKLDSMFMTKLDYYF